MWKIELDVWRIILKFFIRWQKKVNEDEIIERVLNQRIGYQELNLINDFGIEKKYRKEELIEKKLN